MMFLQLTATPGILHHAVEAWYYNEYTFIVGVFLIFALVLLVAVLYSKFLKWLRAR